MFTLDVVFNAAILAGAIQGITEWIPVSSTAQVMAVLQKLGLEHTYQLAISLHWGTLLAAILYFLLFARKWKYVQLVFVLSIFSTPALLLKPVAETYASTVLPLTPLLLLITGKVLMGTKGNKDPENKHAAIAGLAQSLAVFPGISRSGVILAALFLQGIKPDVALDVAFLSAIPASAAAAILYPPTSQISIIGGVVALLVSIPAMIVLRKFVRKYGPAPFCFVFAAISVILLL